MQRAAAILCLTISLCGCATAPASGLNDLKSKARLELYKNCMSLQMKKAPFGTGLDVHLACQAYSRQRVQ